MDFSETCVETRVRRGAAEPVDWRVLVFVTGTRHQKFLFEYAVE